MNSSDSSYIRGDQLRVILENVPDIGDKAAREFSIAFTTAKFYEMRIRRLEGALSAMLTHMGMDEDEFNKPTFDQARAALGKP